MKKQLKPTTKVWTMLVPKKPKKETKSKVVIYVFGHPYVCEVSTITYDIATDRHYINSVLGCVSERPAKKKIDVKAVGKKFESYIKCRLAESKKRMRIIDEASERELKEIRKFEYLIHGVLYIG